MFCVNTRTEKMYMDNLLEKLYSIHERSRKSSCIHERLSEKGTATVKGARRFIIHYLRANKR